MPNNTNHINLNLNARVKVVLNDRGLKIYNDFHEKLQINPPTLENNILVTELWSFANIFGPYLYNGSQPIMESTTLTVID